MVIRLAAASGGVLTDDSKTRWAVSNAGASEHLQEVVDRLLGEVAALRRSRRRVAEASYADRRAIERDLHDGAQQHLVALAVNLQRLAALMDRDPVAAKALLDEMAANVREAMDETTELAQRICPPLLDARGLASAIRSTAQRAGITVLVDIRAGADYPPEIATALYWSCSDALLSVSGGSGARVSAHGTDGGLTFEIAIAADLEADGLQRLRDRIESLDGRVDIEHPAVGGSRIHGWLPVSR